MTKEGNTDQQIEFFDKGPDDHGKRRFCLTWKDPTGIFRPEPSKIDGQPVGFRRAQMFHAVPDQYVKDWKVKGK